MYKRAVSYTLAEFAKKKKSTEDFMKKIEAFTPLHFIIK